MMLAIHVLAGAALAQSSPAVGPGLIAAFSSHFLLDYLPHHEYEIENLKAGRMQGSLMDIAKACGDLAVGSFLLVLFSGGHPSGLALAGGLLGILPDGFSILSRLVKNKVLRRFQSFHDSLHFPHDKALPAWTLTAELGIITAAALLWFAPH